MASDTSDAEVSDMSDEDGGRQPTRRALPNGIKRTVRCDLHGLLQGNSRNKGLGYRQGVSPGPTAQARGATVGLWALQRMVVVNSKYALAMKHELWKDLDPSITGCWELNRVPILAAIWFGANLYEDHRSEQWSAALYAMWVCTRSRGPFSWNKRPDDYRPVFTFDPVTLSEDLSVRRLLSLSVDSPAQPCVGLTPLQSATQGFEWCTDPTDFERSCKEAQRSLAPAIAANLNAFFVTLKKGTLGNMGAARRRSKAGNKRKRLQATAAALVAPTKETKLALEKMGYTLALTEEIEAKEDAAVTTALKAAAKAIPAAVTAAQKKGASAVCVKQLVSKYGGRVSVAEAAKCALWDAKATVVEVPAGNPAKHKGGVTKLSSRVVKSTLENIQLVQVVAAAEKVLAEDPRTAELTPASLEKTYVNGLLTKVAAAVQDEAWPADGTQPTMPRKCEIVRVILNEALSLEIKQGQKV